MRIPFVTAVHRVHIPEKVGDEGARNISRFIPSSKVLVELDYPEEKFR
jgi:hypothetical protein